jgi:hypothetical protein
MEGAEANLPRAAAWIHAPGWVRTGAVVAKSLAPAGGVLIGPETYEQLPPGTVVEERSGLRLKGKNVLVDAYVLHAVAC